MVEDCDLMSSGRKAASKESGIYFLAGYIFPVDLDLDSFVVGDGSDQISIGFHSNRAADRMTRRSRVRRLRTRRIRTENRLIQSR